MIDKLEKSSYKKVEVLLNETNDKLFIGPNNLLNNDSIENIQLFSKLIYNQKDIEKLNNSDTLTLLDSTDIGDNPISNHLIGIFTLGRNLTSHEHIIHGGAIAAIIDEFFVKVALPLTENNYAVTANLNIKYLKPIKIDSNNRTIDVLLNCYILNNKNNKKFTVVGSLLNSNGVRYCAGELLVVVPREPL